jgi:glucose-1-phosphate adenylyltransferase
MNVLTIILAGGQGSRLSILGDKRAKPAIPFAGKYRIIDFPLSNTVNSDLYRIAVLTQFRPHSLMEHLGIGEPWDLNRRRPNGIQIWQPFRGRTDQDWYRGTADAIYQNRNFIAEDPGDTLLVLAGDHIYKQDYREMLRFHQENGAKLTIAVMNVTQEETHRFGIMSVDEDHKITRFVEKPKHSESTLASMGIYVFDKDFLLEELEKDAKNPNSAHDFGKNIIPEIVNCGQAYAFPFQGYWVDVGTIQSYWETNLALLVDEPELDLYDHSWTIHTRSEERPPVKVRPPGLIHNSLVSNGCVILGEVVHSVLSPGVVIEQGAMVRDSVIMNGVIIRSGAVVNCSILDKEVEVGANTRIGVSDDNTPNQLEPANLNTGITIVGKRAMIPPNMTIGKNCRIDSDVCGKDFSGSEVPSGQTIQVKK